MDVLFALFHCNTITSLARSQMLQTYKRVMSGSGSHKDSSSLIGKSGSVTQFSFKKMCNSKTGQNIFLHVPNTMGGTDSFKIIFIKVVFLGFIT